MLSIVLFNFLVVADTCTCEFVYNLSEMPGNCQGMTYNGTNLFWGSNTGGTDMIYVFNAITGNYITNFAGVEHNAGLDYSPTRGTIFASSYDGSGTYYSRFAEIWTNNGTTKNTWIMPTDAKFAYGGQMVWTNDTRVILIGAMSSSTWNPINFQEVFFDDDGSYDLGDYWTWTNSLQLTPQGADYCNNSIYFYTDDTDDDSGVIHRFTLPGGGGTANKVQEWTIPGQNQEGEGITFMDNYLHFGLINESVFKTNIPEITGGSPGSIAPEFQSINGQGNNTDVYNGRRYFNWTRITNATVYELQISNNSIFTDVFLDLSNISLGCDLTSMPGGSYTEYTNYCVFYLPYMYNVSWYGSHYYRVRAYTAG